MGEGNIDIQQAAEQYGQFVVTRQLAVEQDAVIYRARRADAAPGEKAEKYVVILSRAEAGAAPPSPPTRDASGLAQDRRLDFLEVVKQQKRACESGSPNLVPVLEFGLSPAGAWYATDYYPRGFLKKWIAQRAGVSEDELRHVIGSIVRSLEALQRHCQRSHGNLAAGAVLIGGKIGAPLREAPLFLTYLAPGEARDAERFELADLRALGVIVYQLVCRIDFNAFNPDDYPLAPSEHWRQLGEKGEYWRNLCNRLLDPALTLEQVSLTKLAAELAPRGSSSALTAVAGVVLMAALAGGGYYFWRSQRMANSRASTPPPSTSASNAPAGSQIPVVASANTAEPQRVVVAPPPATNRVAPPPPANTPPTISPLSDIEAQSGQAFGPVSFQVGDAESDPATLAVVVYSLNQSVIPNPSLQLGGKGADRTLTLLPEAAGTVRIGVIASDGLARATNFFTLTVRSYAPPAVTGLTDQTVKVGTRTARLPFKVGASEADAARYFVATASAKPAFLPDSSLAVEGSGIDRVLVINPVPNEAGEAILAVSVGDSHTNVTQTFWFKVAP